MNFVKFLKRNIGKNKKIHELLLVYFESKDDSDFSLLQQSINDFKIRENIHDFKNFLHLISKISDNYKRSSYLILKIERIFQILENDMKQKFSNFSIFNIFKSNKRILLLLFEKGIIKPDVSIANFISDQKYQKMFYPEYFFFEFKEIFSQCMLKNLSKGEFELSDEKRKIGENDNYICQLIRNDSIDDFIIYTNQTNYKLQSKIPSSIYETNQFLLKKGFNEPTLLEYAAFCGSVQIFKYMLLNNVSFCDEIWFYAIHGGNEEIIYLLEEKLCYLPKYILLECLKESVKCHQINIMNYIQNNHFDRIPDLHIFWCFHYYNFLAINIDEYDSDYNLDFKHIYKLCKYDYLSIISFIMQNTNIDINMKYNVNKYEQKTLLHTAVAKGNTEMVQLFLEQPNIDANSILIKNDSCNNHREKTALVIAVMNDNLEIANILLKHPKTDVNLPLFMHDGYENYREITPLQIAVEKGNYDMVKLLLTREDNELNIHDNYEACYKGNSALHFAVINGDFEMVKFLLEQPNIDTNLESCNINYKNGKTAFHDAVIAGNLGMVKLLLSQSKIDINFQIQINDVYSFPENKTALQIAIEQKDQKIINLFLKGK